MMGFTSPQTLLLLINAFVLTTQDLLTLKVSPVITAECGKPVTLTCNASSNRDGLSIKNLKWTKNDKSLCGVNADGNITEHHAHTPSEFHCEYKQHQLSLIFKRLQPVESGHSAKYMCKLHSNQGMLHEHTRVELQGCCGNVKATMTSTGPNCTFTEVYPDADVHWFVGSRRLTGGSATTENVEESGWITVHTHLEKDVISSGDSQEPYNCSLWCPTSGQYINSSLLRESQIPNPKMLGRERAGSIAQTPTKTFWFISVLLAVMMK